MSTVGWVSISACEAHRRSQRHRVSQKGGGLGYGCWGLGFGYWGLGFGYWGLGFGYWGLGFGYSSNPQIGEYARIARNAMRKCAPQQEAGRKGGFWLRQSSNLDRICTYASSLPAPARCGQPSHRLHGIVSGRHYSVEYESEDFTGPGIT